MKKLKVATVVGTRPEIIRLSSVIKKLDKYCNHKLIHTGQNYDYELNQIFFEDLGLRKPDFFLESAAKSGAQTIGNVIISVDEVFEKIAPDAVLVLGDTNSCMSILPAKRRKIPTFHMEAGNRCFDQRVPEEINRKLVDHMADINLTYSTIAREYLLAEGLNADRVIKTGSPMNEVLTSYKEKIEKSEIMKTLKIENDRYFLVSLHREENVDSSDNLKKIVNILNKIAIKYKKPIIFSTHPRTRNNLRKGKFKLNKLIQLLKPLSFSDYNNLQINAYSVLSDSGTITEESSILGFSALNIREAHERPEGMEEASVMMPGLNEDRVLQCLDIIRSQKKLDYKDTLSVVKDYEAINVSEKVVRIIHSYTDYVNRVVWKKY